MSETNISFELHRARQIMAEQHDRAPKTVAKHLRDVIQCLDSALFMVNLSGTIASLSGK